MPRVTSEEEGSAFLKLQIENAKVEAAIKGIALANVTYELAMIRKRLGELYARWSDAPPRTAREAAFYVVVGRWPDDNPEPEQYDPTKPLDR